jgi:hypothetical protein
LAALDEKLLTRREAPTPDADLLEPSYRESVRRFNERRRRENRARWFSFYSGMAELHRRLADEHERKAELLCQDPPAPACREIQARVIPNEEGPRRSL